MDDEDEETCQSPDPRNDDTASEGDSPLNPDRNRFRIQRHEGDPLLQLISTRKSS